MKVSHTVPRLALKDQPRLRPIRVGCLFQIDEPNSAAYPQQLLWPGSLCDPSAPGGATEIDSRVAGWKRRFPLPVWAGTPISGSHQTSPAESTPHERAPKFHLTKTPLRQDIDLRQTLPLRNADHQRQIDKSASYHPHGRCVFHSILEAHHPLVKSIHRELR